MSIVWLFLFFADDDLIFIVTTRAEIDMQNIKDEYQRNYNKALASAIAVSISWPVPKSDDFSLS